MLEACREQPISLLLWAVPRSSIEGVLSASVALRLDFTDIACVSSVKGRVALGVLEDESRSHTRLKIQLAKAEVSLKAFLDMSLGSCVSRGALREDVCNDLRRLWSGFLRRRVGFPALGQVTLYQIVSGEKAVTIGIGSLVFRVGHNVKITVTVMG